jgi:hypothetical protein
MERDTQGGRENTGTSVAGCEPPIATAVLAVAGGASLLLSTACAAFTAWLWGAMLTSTTMHPAGRGCDSSANRRWVRVAHSATSSTACQPAAAVFLRQSRGWSSFSLASAERTVPSEADVWATGYGRAACVKRRNYVAPLVRACMHACMRMRHMSQELRWPTTGSMHTTVSSQCVWTLQSGP